MALVEFLFYQFNSGLLALMNYNFISAVVFRHIIISIIFY